MAFSLLVVVKTVLSLSVENHIIIYSSHSRAYLLTPRIKVEVRCYDVGARLGPTRKPGKEEGVDCELAEGLAGPGYWERTQKRPGELLPTLRAGIVFLEK